MKKHFQYLSYVIRHKWYVMIECFKVGLIWRVEDFYIRFRNFIGFPISTCPKCGAKTSEFHKEGCSY